MFFYCRYYCFLNMFREPLCPSSGAREYYTVGCCLWSLVLGFQVVGMVWSWGLCVKFAGCGALFSVCSVKLMFVLSLLILLFLWVYHISLCIFHIILCNFILFYVFIYIILCNFWVYSYTNHCHRVFTQLQLTKYININDDARSKSLQNHFKLCIGFVR
jgi:hypothetical protein